MDALVARSMNDDDSRDGEALDALLALIVRSEENVDTNPDATQQTLSTKGDSVFPQ